jgi:hypothetical protein
MIFAIGLSRAGNSNCWQITRLGGNAPEAYL